MRQSRGYGIQLAELSGKSMYVHAWVCDFYLNSNVLHQRVVSIVFVVSIFVHGVWTGHLSSPCLSISVCTID